MAPSWLYPRAIDAIAAKGMNDGQKGMNEPSKSDKKALQSILNTIALEKVMESRYTRIALGSMSSALALFMIYRIWHDSWRASKLLPRPNSRRLSFLWNLHIAEVFPIILSFTIFISTMTLVGLQANALDAVAVKSCKNAGSVALPAILALGLLHVVFGAKTTLRALKLDPFKNRFKLGLILDLGLFVALLLSTFGIAQVLGRKQKRCIGTLVFRISSLQLNRGIIGAIAVIIISCLAMAGIIALQLLRTVNLDPNERIAASRMFYYLLITAVLQIFILPFFVQDFLNTLGPNLTSSQLAEYVFFMAGAVIAIVHLFLRANAGRTAIKPRETPWQKRRGFRFFGPNDLEILNISPPLNLVNPNFRPDETVTEIYAKQVPEIYAKQAPEIYAKQSVKRAASTTKAPLPKFSYPQKSLENPSPVKPSAPAAAWPTGDDLFAPLPATPPPELSPLFSKPASKSPGHKRQQSYTLFPGADELKLPATIYSPPSAKTTTRPPLRAQLATLPVATDNFSTPSITDIREADSHETDALPPPGAPWLHRRGSSAESSRTVQIGLRLSSAVSEGVTSGRQSSMAIPQMGNLMEETPSSTTTSNTFDDDFTMAFRMQMRDATGRDLNSFRWIDTPSDEGPGSSTLRGSGPLLSSNVYVPPTSAKTSPRDSASSPSTTGSAATAPTVKPSRWA